MGKFSNFLGFGGRSKYGNKKVEYEGIVFDSKKELQRFFVLKEAEAAGRITNLQRQVRFQLIPAVTEEYEVALKTKTVTKTRTAQRAIYYTCDFQYEKDGALVVEDVKSAPIMTKNDKAYQLRKKMLFAFHGIKIKEVFDAYTDI